MADTNQGSHMATDGQAAGNTSSANRTQGAVPMRQTSISSHSMQTTRRAAKNVGKRSRRRRRSQHHVPVIAFVIVAMAVMGAFTYWMTHQVLDDDNGPSIQAGLEVNVNIPDGAGGSEISEILLEAGVINDSAEFFKEVRNLDAETSMKSGAYNFVTGGNVREVVRQLVEGPNSMADTFTIPEGYTVAQTAEAVSASLEIPVETFMEAAKASNYVNDYPFLSAAVEAGDSLEGYLFPKTYDMGGKQKSADSVIRTMLDQYVAEMSAYDVDAARAAINERYGVEMSEYDIVILASIIEKEAYSGDDWVNVASTFYNRLGEWMPLQSDATMGYITGGAVTPDDLEVESPYNTYLNYGLTPTPICNPSLKSLEAALYPADTNYHFFLIVEEGDYSYHAFSDTYEQHLEAIDKVDAETAG